ncbi:helix-turn-helix domain-containing protein [Neisseria sp. Ec49-e6-T10]|uniref:helix-turn-helix domain-containing protein n=1 Tax=Neisseria sp. Ec49-e6-T10 TaxID=3140744 RepID=UPI003EBDF2BA
MNIQLSEWVKSARLHKNLTQEELAFEVGFSTKASVSAIENGRNQPSFETILKIAEICSYPLPYQNIFPVKVSDSKDDIVTLPFYRMGLDAPIILKGSENMSQIRLINIPKFILEANKVEEKYVVCVQTRDNSMYPNIPEMTTTLMDISSTNIINGKIYNIVYGELNLIRKLYLLPDNKIKLRAYNNEEYEDIIVETESIRILGRVFSWIVSNQ